MRVHLNAALSRLTRQGHISPLELRTLRHELGENVNDFLPLEDANVLRINDDAAWAEHMELVATEIGLDKKTAQEKEWWLDIADWKMKLLQQASEHAQDRFEMKTAFIAQQLFGRAISVKDWHLEMLIALGLLYYSQGLLGRGGINRPMPRTVQTLFDRDASYLKRFADQVSSGLMLEASGQKPISRLIPMTEGQVRSRAGTYGGNARGVFFDLLEDRQAEELAEVIGAPKRTGIDPMVGIVVQYIAKDDDNTCGPCEQAIGWYLPGKGPIPGQVCLGRARCRCRRKMIYWPEKWRQLVGLAPYQSAA